MSAEAVLWTALAVLAYAYIGYPLLVATWAQLRARPVARAEITPTVSVVLAVHDEADRIDARLHDLAALDYPRERLEVVVASDGSTDASVALARAFAALPIKVLELKQRRGKAAALNAAVAAARGEVLLFVDARQSFAPGSLRALVAHFADPAVGAVSGELATERGAQGELGPGLGAYRRYEQALRRWESTLDSSVGVTGAIYAIRRELFEPLEPGTILDDVLVPMRIVRRGYRVTVEPAARARDALPSSAAAEFERKLRTLGGNLRLFARERWLLDPRANRIWLQTVSHKVCRLLGPPALVAALWANLLLAARPGYAILLLGQALCYGAACIGRSERVRARRWLLPNAAYAFCLINWAIVVAAWRCASGRMPGTWQRPADVVPRVRTP